MVEPVERRLTRQEVEEALLDPTHPDFHLARWMSTEMDMGQ
jgi:hypothetical protein